MRKFIGITAEYDPMHSGHIYHIQKSREIVDADTVIVLMSGDFTQRGEPAIANKYKRASIAIKYGADIVIELPTYFATTCAELFAFGAVKIFSSIKAEGYLSFGSESGNIAELNNVAQILNQEAPDYKIIFNNNIKNGESYPIARNAALVEYTNKYHIDIADMSLSNNILAVEYLKSIEKLSSNLKPITIKRIGNYKQGGQYPSSTQLRNLDFFDMSKINNSILENVPIESIELLKSNKIDLSLPLLYCLRNMNVDELRNIRDMGEGLENRIKKTAQDCFSYDQLLQRISTKRYTTSRIKRILLSALLGINKNYDFSLYPTFYNILALKKGREDILTELSQNGKIITSNSALSYLPEGDLEQKARNLYGILRGEYKENCMIII